MNKIALVEAPYPDKNSGLLLGAGYISSALKAAGREPTIFAELCNSYKKDSARLLEKIRAARPDVVGFTLTSSSVVWWAYEFLARLKRVMPGVPFVAGGLHATLLPAETIRAGFDFAVIGDGEETFLKLLLHIENGTSPDGLDGLAWRTPDGEIRCTNASYVQNLDKLPFPANSIYTENINGELHSHLSLLFSRGCLRGCTFCVERHLNRGIRFRSVDNVMAEIADACDRYNIGKVYFLDSSFLEDRRRVMELSSRLTEFRRTAGLQARFSWTCLARADHLDAELLSTMKEAGCETVCMGMESASNETLKKIRKNLTTELNERAIALCRDAGIRPHGYLMVGFPWENATDFAGSADFRARHRKELSTIFFVPTPFPCTQLYNEYHEQYGFTDWWIREKPGPMSKPGRPLYRWLQCLDTFLERNFFNYSPAVWNEISAFPPNLTVLTGGPGVKKALYRFALKLFEKASFVMYAFSPRVEHAVMPALYSAFQEMVNRLKKPVEEMQF